MLDLCVCVLYYHWVEQDSLCVSFDIPHIWSQHFSCEQSLSDLWLGSDVCDFHKCVIFTLIIHCFTCAYMVGGSQISSRDFFFFSSIFINVCKRVKAVPMAKKDTAIHAHIGKDYHKVSNQLTSITNASPPKGSYTHRSLPKVAKRTVVDNPLGCSGDSIS